MENTIASLVDLPKPTGRMPFHLSPDGRRLALGVQRRTQGARGPTFDEWGVPTEMAGSSVVVVDTATGGSMEPFPEGSVSWGAQWSPAGDRLVACVRHEGVACLGLWEVDTGEVELLRNAPVLVRFGFKLPVWTPDGKGIVVPLWPAERDYREDAHGPVPKIDVRSNDPDATTEPEPTVPSWWQCDLGYVSLSTRSVKKLLQQWASGQWRIAPDGRHVACTRYVEGVTRLQHSLFELFTVDIETGEERVLASDIASAFGINYAWSPDSESVAYTSSGRGQPDELFIVAADGSEEPVNLTPESEFNLLKYDTPRWSSDGSKLHLLASKVWWQFDLESGQHRCASVPDEWSMRYWIVRPTESTVQLTPAGDLPVVLQNRSDLNEQVAHLGQDGELKHVADIPGTCTGQIWCMEVDNSSGRYYLMAEEANRPPSVLSIEGGRHDWLFCLAPEVQVSKLGRSELIDFEAAGMQCRGMLLLPSEGRSPYPMIVSVYGGYRGVGTSNRFGLQGPQAIEPQLLCSAGYAVLFPEVPLGEKDPMTSLVEPVLAAVDRAVELGLADGERIGLMGTSYGGYSTVALIAQTDRFRAALAIAPWGVNMTSFYIHHIGWCETGQARLGGSPWENRAAYIENSPFFYLDRVSTPLLLVCGTGDQEGSNQAEETFVALRRLDKRVELRLYKDEHHGTSAWSRDALDDLYRRVLDWFNCHVAEAQPHE